MGIDIGTTQFRVALCEIMPNNELVLKSVGMSPSAGLIKGCIVHPNKFEEALESAIANATKHIKDRPSYAITNFPLYHYKYTQNSSIISIDNTPKVITEADKHNALEKARHIVKHPKQKIIHSIPYNYKVDHKHTRCPVGKTGSHLEASINFILGDVRNIRTLKRSLNKLGLYIRGIIYEGFSLGYMLLSEEERQQGAIVIDMGGEYTKAHIFRDNHLLNSQVIHIGHHHITSDIATCLHTSIPEAEQLKLVYGNTNVSTVEAKDMITFQSQKEYRKINHRSLCQIIEARVDEIFKLLKTKLNHDFLFSDTIHLTGQGSRLKGLKEFMMKRYEKNTVIDHHSSLDSQQNTVAYSIAIGNILTGLHMDTVEFNSSKQAPSTTHFSTLF